MENAQFSGTRPMMSLPQAVKQVLRKYADFSGRATRAEYWWWVLATTIVSLVLQTIDSFIVSLISEGLEASPLSTVFGLAVLLPGLAVTARRLHDIGKSGWWILVWFVIGIVGLIPVAVGIIAMFLAWGMDWDAVAAEALITLIVGIALTALIELGLMVWVIVWMARQGRSGPNSYGAAPRAIDAGTPPGADTIG